MNMNKITPLVHCPINHILSSFTTPFPWVAKNTGTCTTSSIHSMDCSHLVNNHHHHTVKVIEHCQVGPPTASVPHHTSIPLSFFDLPWLCCPLTKRIYFYEFPHPTNHILQQVIPSLKNSLSLTLQHFFPFSSNIVFPPKPQTPHILYSKGDSLTFTVAESTTFDLNNLVSHTPRDVTSVHPFVPILPSPRVLEDGTLLIPPMTIQVTILPNAGFTICIVFRHVVADGRAFHHFMKFWASVCGSRGDIALPMHDRGMILDPCGLKPIFLEALWNVPRESIESIGKARDVPSDMLRRVFVLSREHVENMKKFVSIKCQNYGLGTLHVSTFVVTCSLIWVCKVRSEVPKDDVSLANDDELYMLVLADGRNIPELSIPPTYFGNCLVCGNATVKRSKLVGQNGIFEAAVAIGNEVRCVTSEGYRGVETLMSNFGKFATMGQKMLVIAGSPKLDVYNTDFGWGKPKMSEVAHLESPGLMSLSDCRDEHRGIEVGVALGKAPMQKFNAILEELLTEISVHE